MTPITFGIIVPTYNRPNYLAEAIESILAQSYPHWQLFICDDCSSQDYGPVFERFRDPRIVVTRNAVNGGCNVARNAAIDLAMQAGVDFITLLDDEERFDPRCLEVAAEKIRAHPEVSWFISNNSGERKRSTRDIEREGYYDWIDDYSYGKALRGDKTHMISTRTLGDIRFDGRFRASNMWPFFMPLATRTRIWGYPYASKIMRYLEGGITMTTTRHPKNWLEIWSRFARHAYAIRIRPGQLKAWRCLLQELCKTPSRIFHLMAVHIMRALTTKRATGTRESAAGKRGSVVR